MNETQSKQVMLAVQVNPCENEQIKKILDYAEWTDWCGVIPQFFAQAVVSLSGAHSSPFTTQELTDAVHDIYGFTPCDMKEWQTFNEDTMVITSSNDPDMYPIASFHWANEYVMADCIVYEYGITVLQVSNQQINGRITRTHTIHRLD